jgi:two-component system response regulator
VSNSINFVEDGVELLDYLRRQDKYTDPTACTPDLILLDLNMHARWARSPGRD